MSDPVEDAEKLPLAERLDHSNWKVRQNAYEALEKKFNEAEDGVAPVFREFEPFMKKILSDKNVVSLEKGLDVVLAWADRYEHAPKKAAELAPIIVEKTLGSAKQKTKDKGTQLLLMIMEIDVPDPVVAALIEGAGNKVPKVAAASIAVITEGLKTFGVRAFPVKPVLKVFLPWFENTNKLIRDEAQNLTVELYRWLGEPVMKKQTEKLRPAQLKEIDTALEKSPKEPPAALKYLRKDAPQPGSVPTAAGGVPSAVQSDAGGAQPQGVDPYDLLEPVNVLAKIGPAFYEGLAEKKWNLRKEQIDNLITLADTPKIENGDFTQVVASLKKLITSDSNVRVVESCAKALGLLGKGLRGAFAGQAKVLVPTFFEKFKEKKASTVQAFQESLENMIPHCFSLADIMEDIKATSDSKVPGQKKELLVFLTKLVKASNRAILTKQVKPLATIYMTLIEDSDPIVRDTAYESFGTMISFVGEKAVQGFLAKLDKIKEKKLRDFIPATPPPQAVAVAAAPPPMTTPIQLDLEDLEDAAPAPKKGAPKAGAKGTPKKAAPKAAAATEDSPPKAAPKAAVKGTAVAPTAATKKTGIPKPGTIVNNTNAPAAAKPAVEDNSTTPSMNQEEVVAKAGALISMDIINQLAEKKVWKQRLDAINALGDFVNKMDEAAITENTDVLMSLLFYRPGFSDTNFQIVIRVIQIVQRIASLSKSFARRHAAYGMEGIVEKLTDNKIKKTGVECLSVFCEVLGPQTIFGLIYKICVNHKTPKVISEALLFMASALIDFGLNTVELKPLVDCVKQVLENPNPVVKQSAVLLLAEMFKYMGPSLRDQLKDVKPALLATIEQEFDKLSNLKPMTPAKKLRASAVIPAASATASASSGSNNSNTNAAANDDLPRVDISGKLTPQLLAMIDDNDWKKRQEGLTQLEEILNEANKKIQPKLGNLMNSLKKRLVDTNKSITVAALNILGDLATAIGAAIEPNMKLIMSSILNNYTDNKIPVRVAVSSCLDKWVEVCGMDAFLVYLPNAMAAANGRKELLTWIAKHMPSSKKKANDIKPLIKPVLTCLQDKAAEVRQVSETLLGEVLKRCGAKVIEQETSGLKPAFATTVKALLPKLAKEPTTPARSNSISGAPKSGLKTPSAGSKSPTASGSSSPRPAASSGPPIVKTGKKDARAKAAGSWFFEEPTEEHVNMLKEQSAQSFSPEFHEKMFNFVTYADVIIELDGFLVKHKDAVIDNLDIIFRWLTLRYFESDQLLLDKALELTKKMISTLLIGGYHLNDYEANCIVPIFVSRIGFILEESSRQTMRSVFGQFNKIYPASKLFTLLMQTLNTQNSEARLETLPQLYTMIRSQGMSVSSPEVVVPAIARVLAESTDDSVDDTNMRVREAALTLLTEVHSLVGDEIWKLVANNRTAQEYMATKIARPQEAKKDAVPKPAEAKVAAEKPAEEQPARKAPEDKKPAIKPQPTKQAEPVKPEPVVKKEPVKQGPVLDPILGVPQSTFQLEIDKIESSVKIDVNTVPQLPSLAPTALPSYLAEPTPFLPGKAQSRTAELKTDFKGSNLSQQASTWIREMNSNDANRTIEALKSICIQLKEDESALNFYADPIVGAIAKQLYDSFSDPEPDMQQLTRLSKYLINTLMLMFAKKSMAHSVSQQVLSHLMRALLQLLSDDTVGDMEEGKNILKALNLLIIKLLENTDKTACFSVLISQLKDSIPPLETLPNSNPDGSSVYPKVTDMIVKCLLKITKVLSATINELNSGALLREIHLFLSTHDPHKWKDKDHLPLSAVKTLLNEIVRLQGENISKHLGMIPTGMYPPPVILAYIKLMLKSNHPDAIFELPNLASSALTDPENSNGGLPPVTKESIMAGLRPVRVVPPPEIKLSNADFEQTNMILSAIFKKVEVSETSKQGIVDLYWALKDNPDLDIEPWLKRMNRLFRDYVERGLANLRNSSEGYENEDPNRDAAFNALAPSDVASAALDRLRQLRGRLGLGASTAAPSNSSNGPSFATPVGLDAHAQPNALTITPTVVPPTIPAATTSSISTSSRAPSATVQNLRDRLRAVTTGSTPAVVTPAAVAPTLPTVTPAVITPAVTVPTTMSTSSAGTTTTVQGLRERLAKIKKSTEINN
jgi:cytoskeleton-associated protein 5